MKKTISLSAHLGLSRNRLEGAGVFDSTLGIDTKLYIDPKLLIDSDIPEFLEARSKLLSYFEKIIKIHNQSHISSRLRDEAKKLLAVDEPSGLSIGHGNKTDRGTAIPESLANKLLLSLSEILAVGINDREVMELLSLFVEGFACDRLSDLTASILYYDFCLYTERIAKELEVQTYVFTINGKNFKLPRHPFSYKQIIFIPLNLLRSLPVATSWEEIRDAASQNATLRREYNEIVLPTVKGALDDLGKKSKKEIDNFKTNMIQLLDVYKKIVVEPYNLYADSKGYYSIQPFIDQESNKIIVSQQPKNNKSLKKSIFELITQFQRAIEDNGGNKLLYRKSVTGKLQKDRPHNEDVAQIIFYLLADIFCQQVNVLLTRESDAGRGRVDFSLGTGYKQKILVEIKKSTNNNLLEGFKQQTPAYQKSENAFYSYYVIIVVRETKITNRKKITQLDQVKNIYEARKKKGHFTPELFVVDGLIHPTPSKLRN